MTWGKRTAQTRRRGENKKLSFYAVDSADEGGDADQRCDVV